MNVHLEEDAGKLLHPENPGVDYSLVDLNRAGVPLLEIVSAPDMRSAEEVDVFMRTIRDVLLYLEASDCKMEEGSLRFEASISLRPKKEEALGARVEIKNLNSMKAVTKVVEYEMERQERLLRSGKEVARETRLWDEEREVSQSMRSKETASDYRYFPEPDLVPIVLDAGWVESVRERLIELPHYRRRRFVAAYGLPEPDSGVLTQERELADSFETSVVEWGADPKAASNVYIGPVRGLLNERKISFSDLTISPIDIATLSRMVASGEISMTLEKMILNEMVDTGKGPKEIVREKGLTQISDEAELNTIARRVIESNPKPVEDYLKGKKTAIKFLVGQVMKESKGRANPKVVADVLQRLLDAK